jgi:dihydroorotase
MEETGLVLQVHGEVTDATVDVFARERVFIERVLAPVVDRYPRLRVVLEHVTTADGVEFVKGARAGVAATSRRNTCC